MVGFFLVEFEDYESHSINQQEPCQMVGLGPERLGRFFVIERIIALFGHVIKSKQTVVIFVGQIVVVGVISK